MSELAAFMSAKLPLSVIQFPSGTWGFVGSVPEELAYVYDDIQDVKDAARFGAGLVRKTCAREGRRFATRTWATEADARAEAIALGFKVTGSK